MGIVAFKTIQPNKHLIHFHEKGKSVCVWGGIATKIGNY